MKVTEEEWTTSKAYFVDSIFDYRVDTVLWLQNSHRYAGFCLRQRKEWRKERCCCCCFRTSRSIRRFQNGKGYTTASFSRSLQLKKAFTARNAAGSRLENRRSTTEERPEVEFCERTRASSDTGRDDRCRYKTTSNFAWVSCVVFFFIIFIIINHRYWEFASFYHSSRSYYWLGFWSSYDWLGFWPSYAWLGFWSSYD